MSKLTSRFDAAARQRVATAIADAERQTSAEIVVVAAPDSGRYDRPEDVAGLLLAAIALLLLAALAPQEFHFSAVITLLFAAFFAGVGLAANMPPLRRLLTSRAHMQAETTRAAQAHFYQLELRRSPSHSGVLLYISFFERTAAVIADHAVLEALGQQGITQLCDELTQRLKSTAPVDAIEQVVALAGQRLAEKLPRSPDDTDELPNHFLVLD